MPQRDALPLPISIEEIDRDWLTAALRTRTPDVTVRGFEVVDVRRGTCTKVRLRLDLDEAGRRAGIPQSVILKGGFEAHSREMHAMHGNEVAAYRDVLPVLGLPSPACCFAGYDPERAQGIVILEDLAARGVTFCSALRPQDYDEVARRLTSLAQFHARTWAAPERLAAGPWGRLEEYMAATRRYGAPFLEPEVWRGYIDSPRGAAASVRFHDAGWMREALDRLAATAGETPHAVLHGDTHLGNLYVDADGAPGFFDPLPHRGPPLAEVSYHVVCALDPADRPRWERALVGHYLDELGRNGVTDAPSLDEAMRQYGAMLARAYFIFVINDSVFQAEAINTVYVARISAAMLDHDTAGLLQTIG